MVYVRGHADDYDRWAEQEGAPGWSYAECLPYFKSSTTHGQGGDDYRGDQGFPHLQTLLFTNLSLTQFFTFICSVNHSVTHLFSHSQTFSLFFSFITLLLFNISFFNSLFQSFTLLSPISHSSSFSFSLTPSIPLFCAFLFN